MSKKVVSIVPKPTIKDKEASVRALVIVHSLLADGLFPGKMSGPLHAARDFIEKIHAQALKDYQSDPEYKPEMENGNETPQGPTAQAPTA